MKWEQENAADEIEARLQRVVALFRRGLALTLGYYCCAIYYTMASIGLSIDLPYLLDPCASRCRIVQCRQDARSGEKWAVLPPSYGGIDLLRCI